MLDRLQFTKAYAKKIEEKTDLKTVIDISNFYIKVENGDYQGEFSTGNAYIAYKKSVENGADEEKALEEVLEYWIRVIVQSRNLDNEKMSFEEIKSTIYPFVKSMEYLNEDRAKEQLAYIKELCGDIGITVVLDYDDMIRFITKGHLKDWNITSEELYQLALTNFKRDKDVPMVEHKLERGLDVPFYTFETQDTYDATRILLSDRIKEAGDKLGGKFYISVPNRDALIVFPSKSKFYRRLFMMMNQNYHHQSNYAISPHSYSYQKDGSLLKEND